MKKQYVSLAPVKCVKVPMKDGEPMSDTFVIGKLYDFAQIGTTFRYYDKRKLLARTDIVFGRKQFKECFE